VRAANFEAKSNQTRKKNAKTRIRQQLFARYDYICQNL